MADGFHPHAPKRSAALLECLDTSLLFFLSTLDNDAGPLPDFAAPLDHRFAETLGWLRYLGLAPHADAIEAGIARVGDAGSRMLAEMPSRITATIDTPFIPVYAEVVPPEEHDPESIPKYRALRHAVCAAVRDLRDTVREARATVLGEEDPGSILITVEEPTEEPTVSTPLADERAGKVRQRAPKMSFPEKDAAVARLRERLAEKHPGRKFRVSKRFVARCLGMKHSQLDRSQMPLLDAWLRAAEEDAAGRQLVGPGARSLHTDSRLIGHKQGDGPRDANEQREDSAPWMADPSADDATTATIKKESLRECIDGIRVMLAADATGEKRAALLSLAAKMPHSQVAIALYGDGKKWAGLLLEEAAA